MVDTSRLEELLLRIHIGLSTNQEGYGDGGIHRVANALERIADVLEKEQKEKQEYRNEIIKNMAGVK